MWLVRKVFFNGEVNEFYWVNAVYSTYSLAKKSALRIRRCLNSNWRVEILRADVHSFECVD